MRFPFGKPPAPLASPPMKVLRKLWKGLETAMIEPTALKRWGSLPAFG